MKGIYRAKVLDNNDPSKLGRIKVEVYPMLIGKDTAYLLSGVEGIATDVLPWAVPATSLYDGAGNNYGCICIPKVGSYVFVFFENEDVYQPVYFAGAADGIHGVPSECRTNYPNRKVWKSENGIIIELDDTVAKQELKITHPTGTIITIDSEGTVSVASVKEININSTNDINITSAADINITSAGNINMNP